MSTTSKRTKALVRFVVVEDDRGNRVTHGRPTSNPITAIKRADRVRSRARCTSAVHVEVVGVEPEPTELHLVVDGRGAALVALAGALRDAVERGDDETARAVLDVMGRIGGGR